MELVCPQCSERFEVAIAITPISCPNCEAEVPLADAPITNAPTSTNLTEDAQADASIEPENSSDPLTSPLGPDSINLTSVPAIKPIDESVYPSKGEAPSVAAASPPVALDTPPVVAGVSKGLFLFVATYASLATIIGVYLALQLRKDQTHKLESLPDLAPPKKTASLILIPEEAEMAPKHTLGIGEEQRYGSLLVKVVKVTKEPASFVSISDVPGDAPSPTEPLLKLWLSFENISEDQTFAPLDIDLVTVRDLDAESHPTPFRANQFVSKLDQKSREGQRVLMYELIKADEWRLQGQELGAEVAPGDTLNTFLATEPEQIGELKGDLVWRVHFRKGYNPESGRGVTTLIEVRFHSDDITLAT